MAETERRRRHRATREEILAVARGLMLEEGFEGLSIREIARRTGLGPASLYTYFGGKDEIAAALTEESFRELDEYLARVPGGMPADERLVRLGTAYLEFARENPADLACIVTTGLTRVRPAGVDPAILEAPLTRFAEVFRGGSDDGVFAAGDERAVVERAYGFWALVHGLAVLAQAWSDREASADVDFERLLHGAVQTHAADARRHPGPPYPLRTQRDRER